MISWWWLIPAVIAGFLVGDYVRWAMSKAAMRGVILGAALHTRRSR